MILVTGGAGFIGANIVRALNKRDIEDILVVDDLEDGSKVANLTDLRTIDYEDRTAFARAVTRQGLPRGVTAVLHQGACSDTMATDGRDMLETNFTFSKMLLEACTDHDVPLIYASSAAVYGSGELFVEVQENERPLNAYAYSKYLFDRTVRIRLKSFRSQVAGLRYFNVYGPGEFHKKRMASVAYHLFQQYRSTGSIRLFEGAGGYENGEQQRDFIAVEDVVKVNLYFLDHPEISGIFNVGTGNARSFNSVALAVINACRALDGEQQLALGQVQEQGVVEYFPIPSYLEGKYQSFTQAAISALRGVGYLDEMTGLEKGVTRYVRYLDGDNTGSRAHMATLLKQEMQ